MIKKELLNNIKDFDDNTEILVKSNSCEVRGELVSARVGTLKCTKVEKSFRDDFEGLDYNLEVFDYNKNGTIVIIIDSY